MNARVVIFVALAFVSALFLPARGAPPPQHPPRMFSPAYVKAVSGVLDIEAPQAARLELALAANPDNAEARIQLMAYLSRADQNSDPANRAKRFRHVVWLIEHHPESEILRSPLSRFAPGELSTAEIRRAAELWSASAKSPAVQWHAALFFQGLENERHLHYLEATAAADPNHPFALRPLAHLYAISSLGSGPLAARARIGLDASQNVWVLGNAAYMLQSQHNLSIQRGRPDPRSARLAEHYFLRAQALDPKLDRQAILPQYSREQAGNEESRKNLDWQARFDSAVGSIRRLPVSAFPALPPAIAETLSARNCRIPQPAQTSTPRNVIRGEFYAPGKTGWAVLCSVKNNTDLLVFRHNADRHPESLGTSSDRDYLQGLGGDTIGYSREIMPTNRDFIVRHYRAYGGPKPPPIDHHGIDDAFIGKASVVRYFHHGRWIGLQGAD